MLAKATPLFVAKNYEMNNTLRGFLVSSLRSGKSLRQIADELSVTGTPVSKSTVANWINQIV